MHKGPCANAVVIRGICTEMLKAKKLKTNLPSGWLSLALPGAVLRSSNDDDADILISRILPFSRPVGSRQSEKIYKHKHALANVPLHVISNNVAF